MIVHKTADEVTVRVGVAWTCGGEKAAFVVNTKCGWTIEVLGEWIVESESVHFVIAANSSII